MLADSVFPVRPWSPALGRRERRIAGAALGLSLAVHLALLGLVPDWRPAAPPAEPIIQAILLPPQAAPAPPPPPQAPRVAAAPKLAPAAPAPAPRIQPAPRLARPDAAPAAATASPPAPTASSPSVAAEVAETPAPAAPVATVRPGPAPAAPVEAAATLDPALLARYGQTLSDLLARQQRYPRLAQTRGWEGDVVLKLVIARKGNLVAARVVRSSGHAVLDEHALALVSEVQPFPALPGQSADDDLEVTVPVHYQLATKG